MTLNYISDSNGTMSTQVMRAATAVMPAQNCVGAIVGECNEALLNTVLRGKWGLSRHSPTARTVTRNAIHNICYTVVNSNAMQGFAPGFVSAVRMASWKMALIGTDAANALLVAGGVFWIIRPTGDGKARPELYKSSSKKK